MTVRESMSSWNDNLRPVPPRSNDGGGNDTDDGKLGRGGLDDGGTQDTSGTKTDKDSSGK